MAEIKKENPKTVGEKNTTSKKWTPRKIQANELVDCRSAFNGVLIYASKRMQGYIERWEFGDVAQLEFIELQSMIRTDRAFFQNNWLQIDDIAVLKALNAEKYYINALTIDELENINEVSEEDIKNKISKMSIEMKRATGLKAMELIEQGAIDSIKKIRVLEEAFGYRLTES